MNKIVVFGDPHTDIQGMHDIINNDLSITHAIAVGDLGIYYDFAFAASDKKAMLKEGPKIIETFNNLTNGSFKKFRIPVYYIFGNHDDYSSRGISEFKKYNLIHVPQGTILELQGLTFACLGGVYSSIRSFLDPSTFKNRELRFFTKSQIDSLLSACTDKQIDYLVTHQAAAGVLLDKQEEGSALLNILLDNIGPISYIHGHHHKNYQSTYGKTKVIGLGNFARNKEAIHIIEY